MQQAKVIKMNLLAKMAEDAYQNNFSEECKETQKRLDWEANVKPLRWPALRKACEEYYRWERAYNTSPEKHAA